MSARAGMRNMDFWNRWTPQTQGEPWRVRLWATIKGLTPGQRFLLGWGLVALVGLAGGGVVLGVRAANPPQRQALAWIGKTPITAADLDAEARAGNLTPARLAERSLRAQLLQRVISRRLLAQAAHDQGLQGDPALAADQARAAELVLATALARRLTGGPGANVDDDQARRYMAANPATFAARQRITLDRIMFVDPADVASMISRYANTMEDVERTLTSMKVTFVHDQQAFDSAALPPILTKQLDQLKPGGLFTLPQGRNIVVGRVVSRAPVPVSPTDQLEAARAGAARQQAQAHIDAALAQLRSKAQIRYEPSYQP
jgi:peptidyl-prolyl cis-trans isomerase C